MSPRPRGAARVAWIAAAFVALALAAPGARGDWLEPDPSLKEAQFLARMAARDTVGHADEPARLDTLALALLRIARLDEAAPLFGRVLELAPGDATARAGLGKIALFRDHLDEAVARLDGLGPEYPGARADLFAARMRRGEYAQAETLLPDVGQEGRAAQLEAMAAGATGRIESGPEEVELQFSRGYPVPLVRVKLNGQSVLMAVDTGTGMLLVDASAARRTKVRLLPGEIPVFWSGSRVVVRTAIVQRLEIGRFRLAEVPAGTLSLRKWSLIVNPRSEYVAGVIGLEVLRRFLPTIDYARLRLILRRPGAAWSPAPDAARVPFEMWGEDELTVYGSISGGRRMAMVVQTGVPGCGVGAPPEVFDEFGIKPGTLSRLVKGAGQWLQGRPWSEVTVPIVTVGPVVQDKVPGWSGALDSSELWRHGVRRDALLSNDFFRGRRVTIDWARHELVIGRP